MFLKKTSAYIHNNQEIQSGVCGVIIEETSTMVGKFWPSRLVVAWDKILSQLNISIQFNFKSSSGILLVVSLDYGKVLEKLPYKPMRAVALKGKLFHIHLCSLFYSQNYWFFLLQMPNMDSALAEEKQNKKLLIVFASGPNACHQVAHIWKILFNNVKVSQRPAKKIVHYAGKHISIVRALATVLQITLLEEWRLF